ncbi:MULTISPECIES: hypothetical protein [Sphaerochaeta]|uniref:DUF4342 domain-containing protein n=1 Tax=Sphaerochaeta associata TaxID=1129264 RepID=A0ABY4DDL7_9SPIR|nr:MULTISPECIES: hypothetical protein [Sphaerochaeta]MDT3358089.1 hypothetical protein [Spirochaetota bacterium]NLA97563.1 hypothetical protein [Spirochaetales bacterium]MDD2394273.1 hypothetical protein [Sphaerochaeta sp.]MDD3423694.1 hypothetical protein [Sphaerochaeta sp.]MDD3456684.1 hypothetical protein [Sphaerochaeta sp.]
MNAFTKQVQAMHRTIERKWKMQDCSQFCFGTPDSSHAALSLLLGRTILLPLISLITLLIIVVSLIIL